MEKTLKVPVEIDVAATLLVYRVMRYNKEFLLAKAVSTEC